MKVLIILGSCVAAVLLILLLLVLFAKLKFSVLLNNELVTVYLWNFKIYDPLDNKNDFKKDLDKKANKDKKFEKKYKKIKRTINFLRKVLDDKNDDIIYILKYIKRTFKIKKLDVSLDYGMGDAAVTGVAGGIIWGLISNICGFINRYIEIKKILNIAITPHYTEQILDYKAEFVFYVRILNLLKTIRHIRRFKKTLEGRD